MSEADAMVARLSAQLAEYKQEITLLQERNEKLHKGLLWRAQRCAGCCHGGPKEKDLIEGEGQ